MLVMEHNTTGHLIEQGEGLNDTAYVSRATIRRLGGPLRQATIPAEKAPVFFGVHGAIAEHYGADMSTMEPHATTIDYLVAAAGG